MQILHRVSNNSVNRATASLNFRNKISCGFMGSFRVGGLKTLASKVTNKLPFTNPLLLQLISELLSYLGKSDGDGFLYSPNGEWLCFLPDPPGEISGGSWSSSWYRILFKLKKINILHRNTVHKLIGINATRWTNKNINSNTIIPKLCIQIEIYLMCHEKVNKRPLGHIAHQSNNGFM